MFLTAEPPDTRSQAVARVADRAALQRLLVNSISKILGSKRRPIRVTSLSVCAQGTSHVTDDV